MRIQKRIFSAGAVSVAVVILCMMCYFSGNKYSAGLNEYMQDLKENEAEASVIVAVIDTGIDMERDGIQENRLSPESYDLLMHTDTLSDGYGHGTDIISLIQKNTVDTVSVMSVRVADDEGTASANDIYDGILYAYEHGADIINISMNTVSYCENDDIAGLIDRLTEEGIYVVVSAGNQETDVKNLFPANSEAAIVVGAADEDGQNYYFSNYGDTIDYYSYGKYDGKIGTSFAAAYVTSMIANLKAYNVPDIETVLNGFSGAGTAASKGEPGYLWEDDLFSGEDGTEDAVYLSSVKKTENNLGVDIIDIDWRSMGQEELDQCLAETDYSYVGLLLSRLDSVELEEIKSKSNILDTNVTYSDLVYEETDGSYVAEKIAEIPYVEYCMQRFEEKKDIFAISEWECTTRDAVFYISSPDRQRILKYTITGMYGKDIMDSSSNHIENGDFYWVSSVYKNEPLTYDGVFTAPIISGLTVFSQTVRGTHVDWYRNDGTLLLSREYPEYYGKKTTADSYLNVSVSFRNVNVSRVGYHISGDTVTAYNAGNGIGITADIAQSRKLHNWPTWEDAEILHTNFRSLVDGYADVWYAPDGSTMMEKIVNNLRFSAGEDSFFKNDGTCILNFEPFYSMGTVWRERSQGDILAESDIPEFCFRLEPNTYTIQYDGNGATSGSIASCDVIYGNYFTVSENAYAKTGYTFNGYAVVRASDNAVYCGNYGWQPMNNSIGSDPVNWAIYIPGSSFVMDTAWINTAVPGDTFTFCAQWNQNVRSYTLTVRPNGGTWNGSASDQEFTIDSGDTKTISDPARTGHDFAGWTLSGSGSRMNGTTFTMGTADAVLTANWDIHSSTLIVKPNGGTWNGSASDQTFTQDYNTTKAIPVPVREGYTFAGWTRSGTFHGSLSSTTASATYRFGAADGTTDTITATWRVNYYDIHLNAGTGIESVDGAGRYAYGSTVRISATLMPGYHWSNWSGTYNSNSITYQFRMPACDVELTANGEANTYTIIFDPNDGAEVMHIEDIVTQYGAQVTLPDGAGFYEKYTLDGVNVTDAVLSGSLLYGEPAVQAEDSGEDPGESEENAEQTEQPDADDSREFAGQPDAEAETGEPEEEIAAQAEEQPEGPAQRVYPSVFMGWSLEDGKDRFIPQWETGAVLDVAALTEAAGITDQNGAIITLYAVWDDCPWIQAVDLYYTLEQAQSGFITQEEILSHATASDREDGSPIEPGFHDNGTSFSIPDYAPTDFTQFQHEGSCTENLTVVDSVGSVYKKQITIYVVDTTAVAVRPEGTTRFINEYYYNQPCENGGLEDNSIWKTDPEYVETIQEAFDNLNNDTPQESYYFTHETILEMKEYIAEHGFGNSKEPDALANFYERFMIPNKVQ